MTRHDLKCGPAYFEAIYNGRKTFEVRRNDRGFQAGDVLDLHEFNPDGDHERCGDPTCRTKQFTGRTLRFLVGYVLSNGPGLPLGDLVVMSLLPVEERDR